MPQSNGLPSLLLAALRADIGDAHHVGGAGDAERHAGDDDHALACLGEATQSAITPRDRSVGLLTVKVHL